MNSNKEWALFVMGNRSCQQQHPTHKYDIVIDPVADDTIATLFRNFGDGIMDLPTPVNRLQYKIYLHLFHIPQAA